LSAGWKTLDTQNNSLTIDLSEDGDMADHYRCYEMETDVEPKQVICLPNLVTRRRLLDRWELERPQRTGSGLNDHLPSLV